jgi:hypothetical protein
MASAPLPDTQVPDDIYLFDDDVADTTPAAPSKKDEPEIKALAPPAPGDKGARVVVDGSGKPVFFHVKNARVTWAPAADPPSAGLAPVGAPMPGASLPQRVTFSISPTDDVGETSFTDLLRACNRVVGLLPTVHDVEFTMPVKKADGAGISARVNLTPHRDNIKTATFSEPRGTANIQSCLNIEYNDIKPTPAGPLNGAKYPGPPTDGRVFVRTPPSLVHVALVGPRFADPRDVTEGANVTLTLGLVAWENKSKGKQGVWLRAHSIFVDAAPSVPTSTAWTPSVPMPPGIAVALTHPSAEPSIKTQAPRPPPASGPKKPAPAAAAPAPAPKRSRPSEAS